MAQATNDFIVEMLRRMQSDVSDLKLDVREIRTRVGSLETQMASISTRMDRRDETVEHILRRLDLSDSQPTA